MDEGAARTVLTAVAHGAGQEAILWRGDTLDGSDVDLLVLPGAEARVNSTLAEAGLRPALSDPGHVMWSAPDGADVEIDVLAAASWPRHYPSLDGLRSRAATTEAGLPVASPEDRLLILAAEAVTGRPLAKVLRRARPLLAEPGVRERLDAVAPAEGLAPLVGLITDPDRLERRGRRGRLPYPAALVLALRSRAARGALWERLRGRLGRHPRPRFALVTLSGMDGAGKSTFTAKVRDHLANRGLPARDDIVRIGRRGAALDRIAGPVKKILRREGTMADPVAAGDEAAKASGRAPEETARGGIGWAWTVIVAVENALACRRIARARRHSHVVTDRWLLDHLVDFELRYGQHALGARILRAGIPRADLGFLLAIDAATSAERKPGDQAPAVLERMERRYTDLAPELGLVHVDGRAPREQVEAVILSLVDSLVTRPAP